MAGNPVNIGSGFGKKFLNTGKFGKKAKKKIKRQGFSGVQDFLGQANFNPNTRDTFANKQNRLQGAFNSGPQTAAPAQPTAPQTQDPVQNQQGIANSLIQQSTDLTNAGANILNNGNPASQPLLNAGNNFQVGAQQDFGKVDALAGAARAQGQTILDANTRQQAAADQDIQNLFNAQPLDTLRSNLAAQNAAAQANGTSNSRSGNELAAELQRGLIRDQANARLTSNNQFRGQEFQELNNQRATDLALGNQFSQQGLGQGGLGNQALNAGGNLINNTNTVGANIFNQGFQNQLGSLGFINNAANQQFQTQNQLLQQVLANTQGAKKNRQEKALRDQLLEQQAQQSGGGLFGGIAQGVLGALP